MNEAEVSSERVHAGGWNGQGPHSSLLAGLPLCTELQLIPSPRPSYLQLDVTGGKVGGRIRACQVCLRDNLSVSPGQTYMAGNPHWIYMYIFFLIQLLSIFYTFFQKNRILPPNIRFYDYLDIRDKDKCGFAFLCVKLMFFSPSPSFQIQ